MISSWCHQVPSLCPFVISKLCNYWMCYRVNVFWLLTNSTNHQNKITYTYGRIIGKHMCTVWITGFCFPGIGFNIKHLDYKISSLFFLSYCLKMTETLIVTSCSSNGSRATSKCDNLVVNIAQCCRIMRESWICMGTWNLTIEAGKRINQLIESTINEKITSHRNIHNI